MYGSRALTPLVLISDDVINRILKLDIQTNILVYVTRWCTDLTSKVLKERTFGQSSALLLVQNSSQGTKSGLNHVAYTNKVHFLCNGKCVKNCHKKSARRATDKKELIYFPRWGGGGGGRGGYSDIFMHT